MKIKFFVFFLLAALLLSSPSHAQMLDDDMEEVSEENKENHEVLFEEMFSDYKESIETDNKPKGKIEELATDLADHMKKVKIIDPSLKAKEKLAEERNKPTEGELYIGVSKGSFKLFKDLTGKTNCAFGVTLKSTLNKDIKNFSLRLVYPHRTFAFIYRNIKAGEADERFITTSGDICYNLTGVPDIDINRCRIYGAETNECAKRLIWDEKIESPDMSKNPYF